MLCLFSLAFASGAQAELIPAVRLVGWQPGANVGVPGGIDQYLPGGVNQRMDLIDVTQPPYNADRTGATDASPSIQAAIDAATSGQVVYLPAGTYRCDATLYLHYSRDNITLRGAGAATVIRAGNTSSAISVGTASDYNWAWPTIGNAVTAGLNKGSTSVTIGDTAEFAVGKIILFAFENDLTIPVLGVGGGADIRRQMCVVTGKTASTLTFSPPLYDRYGSGALAAKVNVAQLQTDGVGIEDLTVDYTAGMGTFGVQFEQAYGCWAKGVRVIKCGNYGFFLYDSLRCEIRKSMADQRKTEGTNGGGLLCNNSAACLVEDNIFYKFFPLVEVNQSSCGNVFAYNLCEDSRVFGSIGAGIDSNHGPHNSYNLYEGNVSPNLQCDGYFGGASRDTVFRNWFHASVAGESMGGVCIILNRFTRDYTLVGNVLGKSGGGVYFPYSFGNPNMGNGNFTGTAQPSVGDWWESWGTTPGPGGFQEQDLDVAATTIRKANYSIPDSSTAPGDAPLGADALPNSLFRAAKPTYFGALAWPAFDPANPGGVNYAAIPAGYRYVYGVNPPGSGGDTTAPTVPANLAAVAGGVFQITLTWTAATDDVSVTGYLVERSQGAGAVNYTQLVGLDGITYGDTGLSASTVYNYRVRSVDGAGNLSGYTSVVTAITGDVPPFTEAELAASGLVLSSDGIGGRNATLTSGISIVGHSYQLQTVDNLAAGIWTDLGSPVAGTGAGLAFVIHVDPAAPRRFYRLLVQR